MTNKRYTEEEMQRFREVVDPMYHEDLPDDLVANSTAFVWWLFGERLKNVGREIVKVIREDFERVKRRLGR